MSAAELDRAVELVRRATGATYAVAYQALKRNDFDAGATIVAWLAARRRHTAQSQQPRQDARSQAHQAQSAQQSRNRRQEAQLGLVSGICAWATEPHFRNIARGRRRQYRPHASSRSSPCSIAGPGAGTMVARSRRASQRNHGCQIPKS